MMPTNVLLPELCGVAKPRLFVGSSREKLEIARAMQEALDYDAEVIPWEQGVFGVSEYPLESLEAQLDSADFGAFVFAPDDVTMMRGEQLQTVRDNVIFELGLFIGRLGRKRTFIVCPKGANLHLPSDLSGFTPVHYESERSDKSFLAALGPAANRIRSAMRDLGPAARATTSGSIVDIEAPPSERRDDGALEMEVPGADWSRGQYEHSYMSAVFRHDEEYQALIDTAFRGSNLVEETGSIAEWEAFCAYIQMLDGTPGTLGTLRQLAEQNPNSVRVWRYLGLGLSNYDDEGAALEAHERSLHAARQIQDASGTINIIVNVAQSSKTPLDLEALRSAIGSFSRKAVSDEVAFAAAMRKLAEHGQCSRIALAIDEVRVESAPDDVTLRFSIAHQSAEDGNQDVALLHYESIPYSERTGAAWNNLAVVYQHYDMPGKAVSAYERSSEMGETIAC